MQSLGISTIRTAPRARRSFAFGLSINGARKSSSSIRTQTSKRLYPGLGLDLRTEPPIEGDSIYPMGSHPDLWHTCSEVLPVRELAMMSIMDKLTEKTDWHKKIFDDTIVKKWREEALAVSNGQYWELANHGGNLDCSKEPEGIMDSDSFDYVRISPFIFAVRILTSYRAVCPGTPCESTLF